jgi:hypothetical protein
VKNKIHAMMFAQVSHFLLSKYKIMCLSVIPTEKLETQKKLLKSRIEENLNRDQ